MDIQQLNNDHGIAGQIVFIEGEGGLPFARVQSDKASALISVYAGQVLSFQPGHAAEDLLFLSNLAYYQPGKAIKGGAPVCWPWFGPDPEGSGRPAHGFVRNRMWEVAGTAITQEGAIRVTLALTDTSETHAIWPRAFVVRLEITISDSLNLELVTRNPGPQAFSITQAFHTYFGSSAESVGDIRFR